MRLKASSPTVAAWLRILGDQRILVIHNLGREPAEGVSLSLREGPLCGAPTALFLYAALAPDADIAEPVSPTVTATGGLDGYMPFPVLPGGSTAVIDLVEGVVTTEP